MARFCTKCGATLNENDPFCGRCGCQVQKTLVQSPVGAGTPQVPRHPPTSSSFSQESRMSAQAASASPQTTTVSPQTTSLAPTSNRSRLPLFVIIVFRVICIAYGLAIFCMFGSLMQDVDNNMLYNKWNSLATPQVLHDHAVTAGGLGLLWGILLGSVGSWIKAARDKRRTRQ